MGHTRFRCAILAQESLKLTEVRFSRNFNRPTVPPPRRRVELGLACRSRIALWKCTGVGFGLIRPWVRDRFFRSLFRSMLNNRWGDNGQAHFGGRGSRG